MPFLARNSLTAYLPIAGAGAAGLAAMASALLLPTAWLESAVWRSGIAALLPVAEPPLGATARAALALGGGGGIAAVAWAALFLLWGSGGPLAPRPFHGVRRGDAHPDAPPRPPLSVLELGVPAPAAPPSPPQERDLPADLDQPLAAFDPAAVPAVPREPVRAVAPLAAPRALADGERIETFDLSPRKPGDDQPSIEQLLRRLETGAARLPAAAR